MLFALIALEKFAQTSKYWPDTALNGNRMASAVWLSLVSSDRICCECERLER